MVFRRNLWGLKPYGLAVSVAATIALGWQLFNGSTVALLTGVVGLVDYGMTGFWLVVVRPGWVMILAQSYAERLMEALDRMDPGEGGSGS